MISRQVQIAIIESLDKIKSYIELFDRKLEGSGEKDKKEFIFWLEKLKKVISIFEIFIDPTIPDEHIVDFLSLFPTNQRKGIQTVFALCKTLNQLATSKVKFAVSSKSKSLYDFSRCFVEGNSFLFTTLFLKMSSFSWDSMILLL